MKPFEYTRAKSVEDAIRINASNPDARFLAGGSNLVDLMKYGVEGPTQLIDVSHLPLSRIEEMKGGGLRIGALVKNSDLAAHPRVVRDYPVLSQAILNGASPQLRNMATTAGNLLQRTRCYYFYDTAFPCNKREPGSGCPAIAGYNRIHAILGQSPSCIAVFPSDMSVAMALLDAVVNVQGPKGSRAIPIHDFHRLPGDTPNIDTNLARDEMIISVDLPVVPVAVKSGYVKVRDRNSYAFALVSIAAALSVEGGNVKEARIAMGGVAHKPWRAFEAEKNLVGQPANTDSYRKAAEVALQGAQGYEHNSFKIELAKRAIVRELSDLTEGMF
jgi:xanthine dehydrogenase YagS FAD-binding subunit